MLESVETNKFKVNNGTDQQNKFKLFPAAKNKIHPILPEPSTINKIHSQQKLGSKIQ